MQNDIKIKYNNNLDAECNIFKITVCFFLEFKRPKSLANDCKKNILQ